MLNQTQASSFATLSKMQEFSGDLGSRVERETLREVRRKKKYWARATTDG